jgi:hypothetical protein
MGIIAIGGCVGDSMELPHEFSKDHTTEVWHAIRSVLVA